MISSFVMTLNQVSEVIWSLLSQKRGRSRRQNSTSALIFFPMPWCRGAKSTVSCDALQHKIIRENLFGFHLLVDGRGLFSHALA